MTVLQIQAILTYLGYDPGDVDGIPGKNTRRAVLAFQAQEGLETDGSPGPLTQAALLDAVAAGRFRQTETRDAGTGPEWWKEIRYFQRTEAGIGCPCGRCGGFPVEPSEKLMRLADKVREAAGAPMYPSSTVRCQAHNDELRGSVKNSRHVTGRAMDFRIRGWGADRTLALVRKQPEVRYAYAIDGSYVHMDVA